MKLRTEIVVDAPAADAWHIIGERAGDIAKWTSVIRASFIDGEPRVGAIRTCYLHNSKRSTEVLTQFDTEAMVLAYTATSGIPRWIKRAANHWSIESLGPEQCLIRIQPSLDLVWWMRPFTPLVRFATEGMLARVGEELKHGIEHVLPHPRRTSKHAHHLSTRPGREWHNSGRSATSRQQRIRHDLE